MEATAVLKIQRMSAQKGRLIADQIRGLKVERALEILQFSTRRAAKSVKKVLESAIANAEHNLGADIDELKVKRIQVDEGPSLKRFHARAKGRGVRILKRTSHITITVGDSAKPVAAKPKAKPKAKAKSKAAPKAKSKKEES